MGGLLPWLIRAALSVAIAAASGAGNATAGPLRCPAGWQGVHWSHSSEERLAAIRARLAPAPSVDMCPANSEPGCFLASVERGGRAELDGAFVLPQRLGAHAIRWYDSPAACDVIRRTGVLVLVGDSLTRHLAQALLTVLVGNYYNATELRSNHSLQGSEGIPRCVCDWAYNDGHYGFARRSNAGSPRNRYCREHSIALFRSTQEIRALVPGFCPSWGPGNDVVFEELFLGTGRALYARVSELLARSGPLGGVLYSAGGLHTGLHRTSIVRHFTDAFAALEGFPPLRQVCASVHAPGDNQGAPWRDSQGAQRRLAYNRLVRAHACRRDPRRQFHFDAWAPTLNATSFDGTHYGQATNVVLAQLLLNLLDITSPSTPRV